MKTMDELIAASEADIGPVLTQMIVEGDIAHPLFDNYVHRQQPSNAAACLAAALGDIEVLCELGFLRSETSTQSDNYCIIRTLVEHNKGRLLKTYDDDRYDFVPYIEASIVKEDFHVLNYFRNCPGSFTQG